MTSFLFSYFQLFDFQSIERQLHVFVYSSTIFINFILQLNRNIGGMNNEKINFIIMYRRRINQYYNYC